MLDTNIGRGAGPSLGSHPAGYKPIDGLPLVFARSAVMFPTTDHHWSLASTKLVTEAHVCEQLAQGHYMKVRVAISCLLIASFKP